jgi:hypothetical protein
MSGSRRITGSRRLPIVLAAASLVLLAGCTEWMDTSPGDLWDSLTPSSETLKKMSPANMWHNLQPYRLQQLNRGPGMSSDVYYSVSDPPPQRDRP